MLTMFLCIFLVARQRCFSILGSVRFFMFADEFVERTFFILLHKMNLCQLLRYVAHAEVEEERLTSAASVE